MEIFISFFTHPRVVLAALLFTAWRLTPMALSAPKPVVAPAPPQPVEQKVTVKRGGSVDVPLKIYGTRAQTLSWIIKQPPVRGKLSAVRATGAESAVVTYRPPADLSVASDRFTFSVRSNEGVSAPVEVTIAITDDPPQIHTPGELNFGTLLMGASVTKTLEFSNNGGGIAEGTFEVGPPWTVQGSRDYKLPSGERRVVKIVFTPDRVGKFESEVKFTSHADAAVILRGVAEDALAVAPLEIVLTQDAGRPLRAASFEIRNNTNGALEVAISASPRLIVKKELLLPAHESATLTVHTAETDVAALEDTMEISAGTLAVRLPVTAKALPALIQARPESVIFQKKNSGAIERVIFENHGGMESKVTLSIGVPFSVGERDFVLAPGAEKEITISLSSESVSGAQAVLKVGIEGGGFEIPVEAGGLVLPMVVPSMKRTNPPGRTRQRQDEESATPVAGLSGIFAATIEAVSAASATFQWKGEVPVGAELRCFQRVLATDAEGNLVTAFQEYTACRFFRRQGAGSATVEGLEPGKTYLFRIDAVIGDAAAPVTFAQIRTPSPPVRESFFSLVHILFVLAIIAGGVSIWQRVRPRGGF